MEKLITVIIPIYNGEKFIKRVFESILNQTIGLEKIKILAINDGSQDGSQLLLKSYQERFPEVVRLIHQKNQGIAQTSNTGIEQVSTLYFMIIGQDDWYDSDFLEKLYTCMKESKADVVSGGFRRVNAKGKVFTNYKPKTNYDRFTQMAVWAKLHRTAFVKEHQLMFPNNLFVEDHAFTLGEIVSAQKWEILNDIGYNYFYNDQSIMTTQVNQLTQENIDGFLRELEFIKDLADKMSTNDIEALKVYLIKRVIYTLFYMARGAEIQDYLKVEKLFFDKLLELFPDVYQTAYLKFGIPYKENFKTKIMFLYLVIRKFHLSTLFAKIYCKGKNND